MCLLHSEALPCPRPRGLVPSTRIVSPCFARPRFQLGLSSRAPPDLTKRARSTLSDKSWLAFITMYSTLQMLQRGHFSSYARFENCSPAFNSAVSLFVMSESRRCLTCLFRRARHHFFALNIKANFIRLCIGPRHATLSCLTRGLLVLSHNRDVYHSIKESHLRNLHYLLNCLLNCMSGWYLASQYHRYIDDTIDDTLRDTFLVMIWTTSTTTFHSLWYGGFDDLHHGLLKNPFLMDHFDTSHNLLLEMLSRAQFVQRCTVGSRSCGIKSHNFTDLLHDLSSQSSSASRRLDATPKIIILAYINQFLSRFVDILYIHTWNLYNGLRSQNCETSTSCSKLHPKQSFSELSAPAW